jgi:tetratricopeptide (TPR) repeat protein
VWAAKFDENYTDIFAVEDSISEQVAHALVPQLSGEERELLLRRETENASAYQAYLKGRYLWNRFTPDDFVKAAEQFREAIALDPNYAQAHVGIADYYNWAAIFGLGSPDDNFPHAKAAAIRALEIDEKSAEAHAALAFTNLCYDFDWFGAEQRFRRSIELNNNYGPAHQWYSNLLAAQGRFDEAFAELKRTLEINPLSLMDGPSPVGLTITRASSNGPRRKFRMRCRSIATSAISISCLGLSTSKWGVMTTRSPS